MSEYLLQSLESLATLSIPDSLDGSKGSNRDLGIPLIKARTDLEAIQCWLAEYANKPATTHQNYRKDAERMLLWALIEANKPLSSLEPDDLLNFALFLEDPKPYDRWCSAKPLKLKRWAKGWKPFVKGLSPTAKAQTLANLGSLFNYLEEVQYLAHNPFKIIRRRLKQGDPIEDRSWEIRKRILGVEEWHAIQEIVENLPESSQELLKEKTRLKFLLALLYFAGLRVDELVSHRMQNFKKDHDLQNGKDRWWLFIKGKGDKSRKIPVNQSLLESLVEYRNVLGWYDLPNDQEEEPLIRSFRTGSSISARRVNQLLKSISQEAAKKFADREPEKAARLKKVSAHWFRHLSFSMQDLMNIRKQHIKENAGHSSERTTEIYVHSIDSLRHDEMEKLTWKINLEVT